MNLETITYSLITIIISYLLGSVPSGFLAGKWIADIDIRNMGSGSTGATNVLRHVGEMPAFIVFILDLSKGSAAILIAKHLSLSEYIQIAAGIASLTGHIWPIWLKGKGGKAVATGLGVFLGISWQVGLSSLGIFLTILSIWKIVSLASVCSAISLPILMFLSFRDDISTPYLLVSLIAMVMVVWRHRTNLIRLFKGKEPKIGTSK